MPVPDLWPKVEPLLAHVERPSRYVDHEWGARTDLEQDGAYRVTLVYPDTYEVGMANQAVQILYARLGGMSGVAVERAYVPWKDMAARMRENEVPLFTLESCVGVGASDLVGITLPHELAYTNVLEVLDLAGIPLRAATRSENDPIVIGGGPCAHNPEPVAPFFDAILVGDGEDAILEIVATHRALRARGASRGEVLEALSGIEGVYVPERYARAEDGTLRAPDGAPARIRRRVLADLGAVPTPVCPVVPYADVVHDRANVEVLRGCSRGCRFCQAGMVYRPVRERSADDIVKDALTTLSCTGYEEVSLSSLSTADHSELEDVLRRLARRLEGTAVSVSVPSLRVDSFTLSLARLLGAGARGGLTFAPEAGSQRLRDVINKNVTEEEILGVTERAFAEGWRRVKLYFMIGLPTESDDDVASIGHLVRRVLETARQVTPAAERGSVRVAVSISTFVPKAHTPFQWEPQITVDEVRRRHAIVRDTMPRKGVELSWHDSDTSFVEAVMARGDRRVADAIEAAWRAGAAFDAWSEEFSLARWQAAFGEAGVDARSIASDAWPVTTPLPWAHIDSGLDEAFLVEERERALAAHTTDDCTFGSCTGCGVCDTLGVDVRIARGVRGG